MALFFPMPEKQPRSLGKGHIDYQLLYELGCKACPLARLENENPDMAPTGAKRPLIYIMGEGPGATEDEENEQFVGKSGDILRERIEEEFSEFLPRIRWNNTVRTRPWELKPNAYGVLKVQNRAPTPIEVECCRPSVQGDIEQAKPKAIFGFGNVPLTWATGFSGIKAWRGRRIPVKIGNHVCWYYSMLHPAMLLRAGKRGDRKRWGDIDPVVSDDALPSEDERMFVFDLRRAFAEIEELPDAEIHSPQQALANFTLITECTDEDLDTIERELASLSKEPSVGIDYETSKLRPYEEGAVVLSAAVATADRGISFGFYHPGCTWTKRQLKRLIQIWTHFLRTCKAVKAVHNLIFELEWTGVKFGLDLIRAGKWEDSLTQANTLDERTGGTKPGPMSLEFLVLQYYGFNLKKLAGVDRANLSNTPLPNVLEYNCLDARYHCLLERRQRKLIKQEGLQQAHYYKLRRVAAIALSQIKGVPVSQELVRELDEKYTTRFGETLKRIERNKHAIEFKKTYGRDFKPLAPEDAIKLFGEMLGRKEVQVEIKTKDQMRARDDHNETGEYKELGSTRESANKDVLASIPGTLPKLILTARAANKRRSNYIITILKGHEKSHLFPDGLLHPSFNTWKPRTGRMSAEDPAVQTWPKRDGEAREVRKPVKAPKGRVILAVDYGQIEARVTAMYTRDPLFCKALWENYDIHGEWAERVARAIPHRIGGLDNIKDKVVMKKFRTDIKNQWTFPLIFGATTPSVAKYLNLEDYEKQVQVLINEFWSQFGAIRGWQKEQMTFYKKHGYVETFTGVRRRGPLSPNKVYNSPIQGITAEIVMDAFCRLSETGDPVLQAELNIHDDLTFLRVPEKKVDYYLEKIVDLMIKPPFDFINVPISLEASVGENWLDMDECGVFTSHEWDPSYHDERKCTARP